MAKPEYHHGDLKRALLEAALELLEEVGEAGLSLRAAARKAGVSHAAPYRHFADKGALVTAVAIRGFSDLQGALETARAHAPGDPADALRSLGHAYIEFALRRPALFNLIFGGTPPPSHELAQASEASRQVMVGAIASGQESGVFKRGDTERLALPAWTAVHGLATILINLHPHRDDAGTARSMTDTVVDVLLDGLRVR